MTLSNIKNNIQIQRYMILMYKQTAIYFSNMRKLLEWRIEENSKTTGMGGEREERNLAKVLGEWRMRARSGGGGGLVERVVKRDQ